MNGMFIASANRLRRYEIIMNKIGRNVMKKSSVLIIAAAAILSSCGTAASYTSSETAPRFQDGIYSSKPSFRSKEEKVKADAQTKELIDKTKESTVYLFGDRKDSIIIPENMAARIQFDQKVGGTVITLEDNPYDWRIDLENNYGYWYNPYWSPYSFAPWRYRPWGYYGYYGYYGWHDPFYMGGWYSPWYSHWYDPWYGPSYSYWYGYHHHYCGWYGGWDPFWGHDHHGHHGHGKPDSGRDRWYGPRAKTEGDRIFATSSSLRGGGGSRIGTVRKESSAATSNVTRKTSVSSSRYDRATTSAVRSAVRKSSSVSRSTPAIRDKKVVTADRGVIQEGFKGTQTRPSVTKPTTSRPTASRPAVSRPATVTRQPASAGSQNSSGYYRPSGRVSKESVSRAGSDNSSTRSYERRSYDSSPSYNRSSSSSGMSRSSSSGMSRSSSSSSSGMSRRR